ncbi:MAG: DUF4272 domain-containing protein [Lachnospiraceae bacterium]|nr:DUF4272 domain-containing protein [Lachnospiraceae bacterium]
MGLFNKSFNHKILTPQERRIKTFEKLKKQKIAVNKYLPLLPPGESVKLKSMEEVKKRALGSMVSIQLACSIRNGEDYGNSLVMIRQMMNEWNISIDDLLPKERVLILNKFTQKDNTDEISKQDVIDIVWTYETYYSLIWSLDLISDREFADASNICNTVRAMSIAGMINNIAAGLRNTEKILDMTDLFYCYHWACEEKRIRPETSTGKLNSEVVAERRRGLEWLISDEKDWNRIRLDT